MVHSSFSVSRMAQSASLILSASSRLLMSACSLSSTLPPPLPIPSPEAALESGVCPPTRALASLPLFLLRVADGSTISMTSEKPPFTVPSSCCSARAARSLPTPWVSMVVHRASNEVFMATMDVRFVVSSMVTGRRLSLIALIAAFLIAFVACSDITNGGTSGDGRAPSAAGSPAGVGAAAIEAQTGADPPSGGVEEARSDVASARKTDGADKWKCEREARVLVGVGVE